MIKPNYQGQTRIVEVDIAETKPLFFKLDPIPARLEIETAPAGRHAVRERQPRAQPVPPGPGAGARRDLRRGARLRLRKTTELTLAPGERRLFTGDGRLRLPYVQRSGRPELLFASGLIGALLGAGAVAAAIGKDFEAQDVASVRW